MSGGQDRNLAPCRSYGAWIFNHRVCFHKHGAPNGAAELLDYVRRNQKFVWLVAFLPTHRALRKISAAPQPAGAVIASLARKALNKERSFPCRPRSGLFHFSYGGNTPR